jgi:hypothetical protein
VAHTDIDTHIHAHITKAEAGAYLLVDAVVACDGAVGGLGLERAAVRGDEHAGHEPERAVPLGDYVGLHVAVIVLSCPHEAATPLDALRHHVVNQPVLVPQARRLERRRIVPAAHRSRTQHTPWWWPALGA